MYPMLLARVSRPSCVVPEYWETSRLFRVPVGAAWPCGAQTLIPNLPRTCVPSTSPSATPSTTLRASANQGRLWAKLGRPSGLGCLRCVRFSDRSVRAT